MFIPNGRKIEKGMEILFKNGERRRVMEEPVLSFMGYQVHLDTPLLQGESDVTYFELCAGYWHPILSLQVSDDFRIVDADWVVVPHNPLDSLAKYIPSCNCSMSWADSHEDTWPHTKECAYLRHMRERRSR